MQRRITAWLAIVALVAGVVLPVHAASHLARGAMAADFCSAVPQKSPAVPVRAHDAGCDACCGCSTGAAIPSRRGEAAWPAFADPTIAQVVALHIPVTVPRDLRARGPPAFA